MRRAEQLHERVLRMEQEALARAQSQVTGRWRSRRAQSVGTPIDYYAIELLRDDYAYKAAVADRNTALVMAQMYFAAVRAGEMLP